MWVQAQRLGSVEEVYMAYIIEISQLLSCPRGVELHAHCRSTRRYRWQIRSRKFCCSGVGTSTVQSTKKRFAEHSLRKVEEWWYDAVNGEGLPKTVTPLETWEYNSLGEGNSHVHHPSTNTSIMQACWQSRRLREYPRMQRLFVSGTQIGVLTTVIGWWLDRGIHVRCIIQPASCKFDRHACCAICEGRRGSQSAS